MMANKCCSKKWAKISLWTSVTVAIICVVVLILFPTIYEKQLQKEITLEKGSLITSIWEDIPIPIYERLYFFNITNADDFLSRGAPLNVTEVGPYTYKSKWVKNNPEWHDNGTVSYREIRTYQFVREKSVGSQDDFVYSFNGPLLTAVNIIKTYNIWVRLLASFGLKLENEEIIMAKTIRELVYDGYEDIIIKLAPVVKPDIPFKDGRFSWLYGKNATDDGLYTVFTGRDDPTQTDILNNWNGSPELNFWSGDTCNMLNGTSIEIGPPIHDDESYTFFQSIFCRSLTFDHVGDVTHHGVVARRFMATDKVFANGSDNPENYCYDTAPGRRSGVLDVSVCQFDAPVFISFPHFHMADPFYLQNINGLNPNSGKHGSHVDVEYVTGVTVNALVRFQINVEITRVEGLLQFDNVLEGIFPVFWAELELALDENFANFLRNSLNNPKTIAYSVLGTAICICIIVMVISIIILRSSKEEDEELIIVRDDDKALASSIHDKNKHAHYGTNGMEKDTKASSSKFSESNKEGIVNKALDAGFSGTESSEIRTVKSSEEAAILHIDQDRPINI